MHTNCPITDSCFGLCAHFSRVHSYEDIFFLQNFTSKYSSDWSFYETYILLYVCIKKCLVKAVKSERDIWLPPQCCLCLHSSVVSRSVDGYLFTDGPREPICPILKSQAVSHCLTCGKKKNRENLKPRTKVYCTYVQYERNKFWKAERLYKLNLK
jgi:hypothetical protein